MPDMTDSAEIKVLPGNRGRRLAVVLLVVFAVALLVFAAPLLIVLLVGMVPTVVAFVCDRDREKYSAIAICAGNLAGVLPQIVMLASQGATFTRASNLLTDVFSLAVMFGGAGAGWVVVTILPAVVAVYMNVSTEARIQRLRKDQRKLVETWGADVAKVDVPAGKPAIKARPGLK